MRTGRILAWQGVIEAAFICMFLIWPLIHELTRADLKDNLKSCVPLLYLPAQSCWAKVPPSNPYCAGNCPGEQSSRATLQWPQGAGWQRLSSRFRFPSVTQFYALQPLSLPVASLIVSICYGNLALSRLHTSPRISKKDSINPPVLALPAIYSCFPSRLCLKILIVCLAFLLCCLCGSRFFDVWYLPPTAH
ncbi:hypothetical protein HDV57DRAFT_346708 [Trichoderma longibrachiatum]